PSVSSAEALSPGRSPELPVCVPERCLGQAPDQLVSLGLGKGPHGESGDLAPHAAAEGELGRSVVVRGFQGHGQVIGTKRQEDALDLEAHPLGRLASLIAALGMVLDVLDTVARELHQTNVSGHRKPSCKSSLVWSKPNAVHLATSARFKASAA